MFAWIKYDRLDSETMRFSKAVRDKGVDVAITDFETHSRVAVGIALQNVETITGKVSTFVVETARLEDSSDYVFIECVYESGATGAEKSELQEIFLRMAHMDARVLRYNSNGTPGLSYDGTGREGGYSYQWL